MKKDVNQEAKRIIWIDILKIIGNGGSRYKSLSQVEKSKRLLTLAPSGDDMLVPILSRTSDPVPYPTYL